MRLISRGYRPKDKHTNVANRVCLAVKMYCIQTGLYLSEDMKMFAIKIRYLLIITCINWVL